MGLLVALLTMTISGLVAAVCLYEVLPKLPYVIGLVVAAIFFVLSAVGSLNEMQQIKKRAP